MIKYDVKVFDQSHAVEFAHAKRVFLNKFLPDLIKTYGLKTALDVGSGFGYFTRYLTELGLEVTAIDGRAENIAQASMRYPNLKFVVHNVEDLCLKQFGNYDLVFCVGLLYHLENPFLAIRNLFTVNNKILVVETRIAPFNGQFLFFHEESPDVDQGINYCALIPSESCFIKILYKAGYPYVYKFSELPKHKEFHTSLLRKRLRTMLIASKIDIKHSLLDFINEPKHTNRFLWYRFGLSFIIENEHFRKILKKIINPYKIS